MNETLEVLMGRKSVRAFEEKPIGQEEKQAILSAAMRAPTAGNSMLYLHFGRDRPGPEGQAQRDL